MKDGSKNSKDEQFEPDSAITAAVDAVMKIVGNRGSVLRWEQIEEAANCERYTGSWQSIVRKVRRRLRTERMQATWPENGVGLRLLTHKETAIEIPRLRQKKMFRQSTRQLQEMKTVDVSKLSMGERKLLASQLDRLISERRSLRSAQKEILSTYETLPRRPLPSG